MNLIAIALTAIAATYLLGSMFVLAPKKAGYSHFRHTISEIGEFGSPQQRFVALAVFLPIGLLLVAVASIAQATSIPTAALALCIAIGYIIAAVFPCDPGSPFSGSTRQAIHNLGGAVEYIGGAFALMTIAESYDHPFRASGFVVLGSAIALSVLPSGSLRGAIQRVAEACLFGSLALALLRSSGAA